MTTLEEALDRAGGDIEAALEQAGRVLAALKRLQRAVRDGRLVELRKDLEAAERAVTTLHQAAVNVRSGWEFDEDVYLASGEYARELVDEGERRGLRIVVEEDRFYCYPSLIRVVASERSVRVDKVREQRLRPSVLVEHLRDVQRRPPRFRPEPYLESLHTAYLWALGPQRKGELIHGTVVPLVTIHELLTLLPGAAKEYSRQEFARDIYLLDRSGHVRTKSGETVRFPSATGTRAGGKFLQIIAENGEEKRYFGIAFEGEA